MEKFQGDAEGAGQVVTGVLVVKNHCSIGQCQKILLH